MRFGVSLVHPLVSHPDKQIVGELGTFTFGMPELQALSYDQLSMNFFHWVSKVESCGDSICWHHEGPCGDITGVTYAPGNDIRRPKNPAS